MIKSIKHKGLKKLFIKGDASGVQPEHTTKLRLLLSHLDDATTIEDMNLPGANLHPLKGALSEHWSIKVSGNWRLTFKFENGNAYIVDYQDYH